MTVKPPSYRIERFDPDPDPETEPVKFSSGETFLVDFEDGYAVVKDTRLQTIADAPRCKHDKIDKHDYQGKVEGGWHTMACLGAPELRALLKALTEEET